jgi:hypothetical protein
MGWIALFQKRFTRAAAFLSLSLVFAFVTKTLLADFLTIFYLK